VYTFRRNFVYVGAYCTETVASESINVLLNKRENAKTEKYMF